MKIKIFIVTYNGEKHLRDNLESLFSSQGLDDHEISVNVINNHSNFHLEEKFRDKVRVYHNELRPDFSTGHLARNWNQAIINGFENLNNPSCDLLIHSQDDVIWKNDWLSLLLPIMEEMTFYQSGNGDAFCCYRPEAVKKVGLWDERFCNIGYHEYDYFTRCIVFNPEKTSINDLGDYHSDNTWNSKPQVTEYVHRDAQKEAAHRQSQIYHSISNKIFYHKWGFPTDYRARPQFWKWVSENVRGTVSSNYIFYPYFEKDVEDLQAKNYVI